MRSLDQQRAANAYAYIASAPDDAVRLSQRLPEMLRINGLLAAWAFLLSKKKQATPLAALLDHLKTVPELSVNPDDSPEAAFLHWVGGPTGSRGGVGAVELRALSHEALAFAGWLKRAAEARGDETLDGGATSPGVPDA